MRPFVSELSARKILLSSSNGIFFFFLDNEIHVSEHIFLCALAARKLRTKLVAQLLRLCKVPWPT